MVVGGEKRRVCGLVDEIVFGGIRHGVEKLRRRRPIRDARVHPETTAENSALSFPHDVYFSRDSAEHLPKKGDDVFELPLDDGKNDMDMIGVALKGMNSDTIVIQRFSDGGAYDVNDAGLWNDVAFRIEAHGWRSRVQQGLLLIMVGDEQEASVDSTNRYLVHAAWNNPPWFGAHFLPPLSSHSVLAVLRRKSQNVPKACRRHFR